MNGLEHPDLSEVSLVTVLRALADPARLAIVKRLACEERLTCSAVKPCPTMPKSTLSNHMKVLRAAGLIETRAEGRTMASGLRRAAFERRFPGLLDAVLAQSCSDGVAPAPTQA
jgi:DNA-binding transcriptional ArsR family regulator